MKKLSVVVSVYNEVQVIELFYQELSRVLRELDCASETIYVDYGSTDGSFEKLEFLTILDKNVKLISFARNFGHEAAMIAGIDYSDGDGIICMAVDFHSVDLIFEIVKKFEEGYEVITMKRTQNIGTDCFAISKKAACELKTKYREKVYSLRGYIQNLGYNKTSL